MALPAVGTTVCSLGTFKYRNIWTGCAGKLACCRHADATDRKLICPVGLRVTLHPIPYPLLSAGAEPYALGQEWVVSHRVQKLIAVAVIHVSEEHT